MRKIIPLVFVIMAGCASRSHLAPQINSAALDEVEFKAMSPRALRLEVESSRVEVEKAGNAGAVEGAVRRAITDVLAKSDIEVRGAAPNELKINVADYEKATKEDGECVHLFGNLRLKNGVEVKSDSYSCQAKSGLAGIQLRGDLNKAYETAIRGLLKAIDKKL